MSDEITSFRGEYRFLSNFAITPFYAPFHDSVEKCKSVEHYFQASKCKVNNPEFRAILRTPNPRQAKFLGRKVDLRDDWEEVKLDVMLAGLRLKFDPDNIVGINLVNSLLATGNAILIEGNTWNDRYWGMVQLNGAAGPVWVGENNLGKLLMQVRQELQEK